MKLNGLHHIAYKCCDPEQTRAFYEDILGLPMVLTLELSRTPSTGEPEAHYFHFFFEMADGSCIAFFDLADDDMPQSAPNVPSWTNHLAMRVDSYDELKKYQARLQAAGVDAQTEIDHDFCRSLYFNDPNGVRLEITADNPDTSYIDKGRKTAHANFAQWLERRDQFKPVDA